MICTTAIEQYVQVLSLWSVVLTDDRHWGAKDELGKDMWGFAKWLPRLPNFFEACISPKSQLSHNIP